MPTQKWKKTLIPREASIQQAIESLNSSGLQIALVVTEDLQLIGTVTDGDIRRALLKGLDLRQSVELVCQKKPLVVPPQISSETVLKFMQMNKFKQVPVVDEDNHVIDLHFWDEIISPEPKKNTIVIMCGGKGVRLRPHTENCPKPLVPVAGKPMLEHIILRAKNEGFTHFIFAIHYLGHMIEEYFENGAKWGVEIDYLREESPLGTAGALSLLNKAEQPLIVVNGDVLSDVRFSEVLSFHTRANSFATMAVRIHEWQHPYGVVHIDGIDIMDFEEKPISKTHVNAGVYVLEPSALDVLKVGEQCDMPTLFLRLKEETRRIVAYPMHEPWLDVGRPADLEDANTRYNKNK